MVKLGIRRSFLAFFSGSVLLFLLPNSAFCYIGENADGWNYAQEHIDRCYNGEGQIEANFCMSKALAQYDREMNEMYKSLSAALVEHRMLRDSQRAWLRFRDAECTLRSSGLGNGSATSFVMESCKLDLTIKRIKDLKHLDSESYCNGCPIRK
jgi:uncharacterized protein YecT (DUF1311 family)